MADPGVPDSWDQSDGQDASATMQQPMSGLSFNPNAPAFVPGKNVHAASFVPGGFSAPATTQPAPTATPSSHTESGESGELWHGMFWVNNHNNLGVPPPVLIF